MENDLQDITASAGGDSEAYRRVVKTYEQQIARLMWRFTRDKNECEILVQDVFVEAFFSLKNYRGQGPFSHWLNKIATRVGYRFWKQNDRSRIFVAVEDFENIEVRDTADEQIDPTEAAAALHKLLAKLPADDRLVLTLMYLEDCSIEQIAERMAWTKAGTKMRAMRARMKLKKIAEKEKFSERYEWIK